VTIRVPLQSHDSGETMKLGLNESEATQRQSAQSADTQVAVDEGAIGNHAGQGHTK